MLLGQTFLHHIVRTKPVFVISKRSGATLSLSSDQPSKKQSKISNWREQDMDRKTNVSQGNKIRKMMFSVSQKMLSGHNLLKMAVLTMGSLGKGV